jgi:hypothetical protein
VPPTEARRCALEVLLEASLYCYWKAARTESSLAETICVEVARYSLLIAAEPRCCAQSRRSELRDIPQAVLMHVSVYAPTCLPGPRNRDFLTANLGDDHSCLRGGTRHLLLCATCLDCGPPQVKRLSSGNVSHHQSIRQLILECYRSRFVTLLK